MLGLLASRVNFRSFIILDSPDSTIQHVCLCMCVYLHVWVMGHYGLIPAEKEDYVMKYTFFSLVGDIADDGPSAASKPMGPIKNFHILIYS